MTAPSRGSRGGPGRGPGWAARLRWGVLREEAALPWLEADHGDVKEQARMIRDLHSILDELGPIKRR
jgi:hypothetical protein